jgi:hypothetical protein
MKSYLINHKFFLYDLVPDVCKRRFVSSGWFIEYLPIQEFQDRKALAIENGTHMKGKSL